MEFLLSNFTGTQDLASAQAHKVFAGRIDVFVGIQDGTGASGTIGAVQLWHRPTANQEYVQVLSTTRAGNFSLNVPTGDLAVVVPTAAVGLSVALGQ